MDFDDLDAAEEATAAEEAAAGKAEEAGAQAKAAGEASSTGKPGASAVAATNGGVASSNAAAPPTAAADSGAEASDAAEDPERPPFRKCAAEAAPDVPAPWAPVPRDTWEKLPKLTAVGKLSIKEFKAQVNEMAPGEYWGIEFPFTPTMLREMGPKWLTKAMHVAGTLPKDNEITRFVSMDVKAEDVTKQDAENAKWGGAGLKILMKVEYKRPGDLPEGMFVKMPHEYTGKNERQKNSITSFGMDWSEVTFYNLFGGRFGTLPFRSPRMYFCDMSRKTTNFINVVELIPYGNPGAGAAPGDFFPAPEKYKDWALPGSGVDLYYAHARTLARFFGWHKLMREKTDQVEQLFMDPGRQELMTALLSTIAATGPYNSPERDQAFLHAVAQGWAEGHGFPPQSASGFLEIGKDFIVNTARHVFPADLVSQAHLDTFFREAEEMSRYCAEMGYYSAMVPEYFTLAHPNAQVDNAFYWRDEAGVVDCGLLDWGGVAHSTIPTCIGNGWMGAEPEMMDEHERRLVQCFVDEYVKVTGVRLDVDDLLMHIKLSQGCVLYGCCMNVRWLIQIVKRENWKQVKSRKDPTVNDTFLLRCYFVQLEMFLAMWKKRSPYAAFQKWLARTKLPLKKK